MLTIEHAATKAKPAPKKTAAAKKPVSPSLAKRVEAIVARLTELRQEYYMTSTTSVSDAVFDALEDELRKLSPKNAYFKTVGTAPIRASVKVALPFAMPSIAKIKSALAVDWLWTAKFPVFVTVKLDGVSAMIYRDKKTKLVRMVTRGTDSVGTDITPILAVLMRSNKALTKAVEALKPGQAIRGELVISNADHAAINKTIREFATPRHLAAGIVNSKTHDKAWRVLAKKVQFLVHSQPSTGEKAAVLSTLAKKGWTTVSVATIKKKGADLAAILDKAREKSAFALDGLVLEDANGNQVAFKGEDAAHTATVKGVLWKVSKHGRLIPTVTFETPVIIDGVKINKTTGYNAKWIADNKVGPGAIVAVVRSNEVIPSIPQKGGVVISADAADMPPEGSYAWAGVNIIPIGKAKGKVKTEVLAKQMEFMLDTLDIKGFRQKMLMPLAANVGMLGLLKAPSAQVLRTWGLGKKAADNLSSALAAARDRVTHEVMFRALGYLPPGLGSTRIAAAVKTVGGFLPLVADDGVTARALAENTKGFTEKSAQVFLDAVDEYAKGVSKAAPDLWAAMNDKDKTASKARKKGKLSGVVFAFTGVRSKDLEKAIANAGGEIGSTVSKDTTYLVVGDTNTASVKATKARILKVKIITLAEANRIVAKAGR